MNGLPGAPRRRRRPLVVLAWVTAALVGFWVLVCAGLMLHPRSREVIDAAIRFAENMQEGMQAPGTAALRAIGCDQAAVFQLGEAAALLDLLTPGEAGADLSTEEAETPLVYCRVQLGSGAVPGCGQVAEAYLGEVEAPGRFLVSVHQPGETHCTEFFDASGRSLGDAGSDLRPEAP